MLRRTEIGGLQRELGRETQERLPSLQVPLALLATIENDESPEDFVSSVAEALFKAESYRRLLSIRRKAEVSLSACGRDTDPRLGTDTSIAAGPLIH